MQLCLKDVHVFLHPQSVFSLFLGKTEKQLPGTSLSLISFIYDNFKCKLSSQEQLTKSSMGKTILLCLFHILLILSESGIGAYQQWTTLGRLASWGHPMRWRQVLRV